MPLVLQSQGCTLSAGSGSHWHKSPAVVVSRAGWLRHNGNEHGCTPKPVCACVHLSAPKCTCLPQLCSHAKLGDICILRLNMEPIGACLTSDMDGWGVHPCLGTHACQAAYNSNKCLVPSYLGVHIPLHGSVLKSGV